MRIGEDVVCDMGERPRCAGRAGGKNDLRLIGKVIVG